MKNFSELEEKLGIKFNKQDLLIQAFTHRSYLNENPKFNLDHNERLEFLGDAVLEIAVTEHLYKNYKNPEGEMTNWRAALVNSQSLAKVAAELGFDERFRRLWDYYLTYCAVGFEKRTIDVGLYVVRR